jgi:hypothetical protein
MHGREGHDNAWMMSPPLSDLCPLRRPDIGAHQRNRADILRNLDSHGVEQGHAFPRPLAVITGPVDVARTEVEGGTELERPCPLLRRLDAGGPVVRRGGPGRSPAGPRRQGGLLVDSEHQFLRAEGTGIEAKPFGDGGREGGVPRMFGLQPQMLAPGLQLMGGQNPSHRGGRALLHAPIGAELTREFGPIPRGEATPHQVRPRTGQAPDGDRDLRGKTRPGRRGQGRRRAPPDAGRDTA